MSRKSYSPVASYQELKRVDDLINQAQTIDDLRKVVVADGAKVGYKAFCFMLGGKMTAEAMKPDEACVVAATLEADGNDSEAQDIYRKIVAVHPEHPIAKNKVAT